MESSLLDTHQKALSLNLDKSKYGTIAEIGAGQETAGWFFKVGGAAGTVAKAMSAYDMTFSDSIYGTSNRYVSRDRLQAMLDLEYRLLIERLGESRGSECTFFAFANTVAARSFTQQREGHGWLGIRFQTAPNSDASQIDLHVCLKGGENIQDLETLGVLGINLIYGAKVMGGVLKAGDDAAAVRYFLPAELPVVEDVAFRGHRLLVQQWRISGLEQKQARDALRPEPEILTKL